jgi:uncharacterized protein (DUF433 family)
MRVTVAMVVNRIGAGHNIAEILIHYPYSGVIKKGCP